MLNLNYVFSFKERFFVVGKGNVDMRKKNKKLKICYIGIWNIEINCFYLKEYINIVWGYLLF